VPPKPKKKPDAPRIVDLAEGGLLNDPDALRDTALASLKGTRAA